MRFTARALGSVFCFVVLACISTTAHAADAPSAGAHERMVEWTVESRKQYADPFNDIDVDVIFSRGVEQWRVPAFWRGGQRWTVRFAPVSPGEYRYQLESTDRGNPDLNGHPGKVVITAYTGRNSLLKHGPIRVSANRRYFEHADGAPFYWLGDTWWTGLSDRLPWAGFQEVAADRKAKGFTVVHVVAGLIPGEEVCPIDPGCGNEGGPVWTADFKQINPAFFDYADRRIQYLVQSELAPVIVGAWYNAMDQLGVAKLKKHWRYIIARYGAYPVFWIAGGEVFDPSPDVARRAGLPDAAIERLGQWSAVTRYIRDTDSYHHPVSVHEVNPNAVPVQDETLTDFAFFQPSHHRNSLGVEVAQLNLQYSRTAITKPLVVGEIGYEMIANTFMEDFQRTAFWLAMLNGAAGHSYGAASLFEVYGADKTFHRLKWSLRDWREGMNLPGSYQIGLAAKLLRQYPWWKFAPHPEWVTPRGTTLLEPRSDPLNRFYVELKGEWGDWSGSGEELPVGEWTKRNGNYQAPYAAGIPREVRIVYLPNFRLVATPPTILRLEPGVRYRAYYWEPTMGIKIDLGHVQPPAAGRILFSDTFGKSSLAWEQYASSGARSELSIVPGIKEADAVAAADLSGNADAALILRFQDADNYLAAVYSAKERSIYLRARIRGADGRVLGGTSVAEIDNPMRLTAEVRGPAGVVALTGDGKTVSSAIVTLGEATAGGVGLLSKTADARQTYKRFEVRQSPALPPDEHLDKRLVDAKGQYRGELRGPGMPPTVLDTVAWDDYGKHKHLLLDAYRPELFPSSGDWVLVMETESAAK